MARPPISRYRIILAMTDAGESGNQKREWTVPELIDVTGKTNQQVQKDLKVLIDEGKVSVVDGKQSKHGGYVYRWTGGKVDENAAIDMRAKVNGAGAAGSPASKRARAGATKTRARKKVTAGRRTNQTRGTGRAPEVITGGVAFQLDSNLTIRGVKQEGGNIDFLVEGEDGGRYWLTLDPDHQ